MQISRTQDAPANGRLVDSHGIQISRHKNHLAKVQQRQWERDAMRTSVSRRKRKLIHPAPAKGNSGA